MNEINGIHTNRKESIQNIISKYGENANDTGNIKVQLALLTYKINHLSQHLKQYRKDYSNTNALLKMVGKRRKMLKYYKDKNLTGYRELIADLGLRH